MHALLPPPIRPKITYKKIAERDWAESHCDLSIWLIEKNAAKTLLKQCRRSPELIREYDRLSRRGPVAALRLSADDRSGSILCIFVKNQDSTFARLQAAAKSWKEAASLHPVSVALATFGLADSDEWLDAMLAAALAGSALMPQYKEKPEQPSVKSIQVLTDSGAKRFASTEATHDGNYLARWLTAQPPNLLDSHQYREALQALAKQRGWSTEFFGVKELDKLKAGAFLAVARANPHSDAGILRLSYRPRSSKTKGSLSLIGKGICFDTGGINLKSHKGMYDMHTDMQGSAVAVGTLLALSQLNAPYAIDCWLALTENEIGPKAYRPQEVITAANGVTIQVVHSDAEGRMVLADTLALAARNKPDLIIDFATLTGACVQALTERMSGAFSNRDNLRNAIEIAGRNSGERVWSFPMDADFDTDLDSTIADIMQCTMDNKGDHILAARFLNRFVPERIPWIHIDLAAANRSGGLGHVPTEITGFGVRWAVQFMQHHSFAKLP
jgi:leucyl aminopeptidase